jgi:hypothetical protein
LNWTKGKEMKQKRIKINKKNKIGEKAKEGEMKGHGCWPSPYPLSLPTYSIVFTLKSLFFG